MTAFARRVSGERLDERLALEGPADELQELLYTLDAMLDGLSESFGAQRRFVANAGHELRGPLTVIRTQAEVTLADPDASPAELRAMGEAVVEACRRTEALLEGLMALARSQRALVSREPTDLAPGARAAVAAVADEARAADVRVRLEAGAAPTLGDRRLLDRLVANLVENAVRHNRPGGTVDVTTATRNGHAAVRVVNTGRRLPDDSVARLTEPFERLGRPADAPGAGLGLSIVRSVAEAHRGQVRLAARDGGGLEAEVLLPAAPAGTALSRSAGTASRDRVALSVVMTTATQRDRTADRRLELARLLGRRLVVAVRGAVAALGIVLVDHARVALLRGGGFELAVDSRQTA